MWAFKTLWDKGLIFESYRVVPYSWAAQAPLSNFETRLDNAYRERVDPALTVAFSLVPEPGEPASIKMLAWTTTPWTLPANLALCVHPTLDYAVMQRGGERYVLAAEAVRRYRQDLAGFHEVGMVKGAKFAGRRYRPLYPYFPRAPNAFVVIADAFVGAEEGTGIVHLAPGFGEDDLETAKAAGITAIVPVDDAGRFTDEVPDYAGQNVVLEANANIIRDLKAQGVVVRHEQHRHSYPHCWRTDQPLIYRAVNSWYVAASALRDRMVELNKDIRWVPAHVRDGLFGNWLANTRDWNISRDRFWGAPVPVWKSDDPRYPRVDVYGALDELERDFGVRPTDLHNPEIDKLVRPNPDDPSGRSMMRRVPEVLDCWFESGSMPFAQLHYPFENRQRFEANFPGDFIVEYVAQTRGWFYTLMVLATALFDRAPFRNCVCHGVVLDEAHRKLSKRLKNYPDPVHVFDTYGADALRWYVLSSPLMAGGDLVISKDGTDIGKAMRQVIIRIWNAYSFFVLYANIDGVAARFRTDQTHSLDRYILAKTRELIARVQNNLDAYDLPNACAAVPGYVDTLNNWYIRSRRSSFWADDNCTDKQSAYDTLYTALTLFCRTVAPLLPLIAERIYLGLTGERSVHLSDWPDIAPLPFDRDLVETMDLARDVCSGVLAMREAHRRRTRLPLRTLTVAHTRAPTLESFRDIIAEAINVKEVILSTDVTAFGVRELKVNPKLGAKLGAKMKEVFAAQRDGNWSLRADGSVEIAGLLLGRKDFELRIRTAGGTPAEPFDAWHGIVVLDTKIYPDLQAEGWARDLVRLVQNGRKEAGLAVTDRIALRVAVADPIAAAVRRHAAYVSGETLAASFDVVSKATGPRLVEDEIDGHRIVLEIERISGE